MQMLFQWDMSQQDPAKLEAKFWRAAKATDPTRNFANQLFEGAARETVVLDEIIVKHADNWRFERLAAIDRAILRLAIHELRATDTPPQDHGGAGFAPGGRCASDVNGAFEDLDGGAAYSRHELFSALRYFHFDVTWTSHFLALQDV